MEKLIEFVGVWNGECYRNWSDIEQDTVHQTQKTVHWTQSTEQGDE
ncbi:MAG: hypothetical protein ABIJ10_01350 [Candidatus Micrarchaeota archaeon]|nr:hypothetical protein [Candidatus Micrarchaeota archaeon]MBU1886720.1 hypothetical protein [Candidatus Micrarchaeota archaeon]